MDDATKRHWMRNAYEFARRSPDPSTQNGAVLISQDGTVFYEGAWNGFPPGIVQLEGRLIKPDKYDYIEHAEVAALHKANWTGCSITKMTMVCPWAACCTCARALLFCGVKKLITYKPAHDRSHGHWIASIQRALEMLKEGGCEVEFLDGSLDLNFSIRMNGQEVRF